MDILELLDQNAKPMKNEYIKLDFYIGEIVYLVTDIEQLPRIVTGAYIRPSGYRYSLAMGTEESWHFSIEISREKDTALKYKN